MPDKKVTLNRFPLFGLFAYRAATKNGYACFAPAGSSVYLPPSTMSSWRWG
jgi:hypothetical protein